MNYLVLGGAGFVGSYLIPQLLASGNTILSIDSNKEYASRLGKHEKLRHASFDVNDTDLLEKFVGEDECIDGIIHLAANSDISKSFSDPQIDLQNTLQTTISALKLMKKRRIKYIFFSSSSAIYGDMGFDISISEDAGPLLPISHYGACKLASEAIIHSYCSSYGFNSTIFRFPNVIGPSMTHGVIYDFIQKLKNTPNSLEVLGNGKQEKSYLHLSDLSQAIISHIKDSNKKDNFIDIFNIGNKDTICVSEIAKIVRDMVSPKASISYQTEDRGWIGDVPRFRYNIEKIIAAGWEPKLSSRDAVIEAVKSCL